MTLGIVLLLIQFAAAVPWLLALTWRTAPLPNRVGAGPVKRLSPLLILGGGLVAAVGLGALLGLYLDISGDRDALESLGKGYAAILQLQLYADVIVLIFGLVLWLWPKGGAVARAAFREGYRQPLFWLLLALAVGQLFIAPFVPY